MRYSELLLFHALKRMPTAIERKQIGRIAEPADTEEHLRRILKKCPELVTESGKNWIAEADAEKARLLSAYKTERDKEEKIGEYAPTIDASKIIKPRSQEEPAATEKQIAWLRQLGVRDEALLQSLGKFQASDLIGKIDSIRNPDDQQQH